MAYFDYTTDNDAFYPAFSTSDQFDLDLFLSQTSGTEEANAYDAFTDGWGENGQPGYTIGPSTSVQFSRSCAFGSLIRSGEHKL
ncbi:hypothetical protein BDM02DRAFT_3123997 [Thelephora ganbajun]|uniref:Uncharacterized protein n=1 Tax=Thelephora ganbajun TaxID=370292 RepID=A0ACB6Z0I1_THEGA|nr:hypothetical protein BDM02DRAFT_3123997 [Thelephora ganbajun]